MTATMRNLREIYTKTEKEALEEYLTFLRFQSVSTDPQYKSQVLACADWLMAYLKNIGFYVERWETSGHHPTIYAANLEAGKDKPTLLLYNHYDVQPVDPLDEWVTPPFEPTIRDGEVYARGAEDNKGQCFYVLQALKLLFKKHDRLPINIKLCIEGEEECGSMGLSKLLEQKKRCEQLKADYLAIVDMGMHAANEPAVTLGVRGIVTMEVRVHGSKGDLHSGSHGGIAYNPLHALIEMLSKLRDSEGKIQVPGFYDDIVPLTDTEKGAIDLQFDTGKYEIMFGAQAMGGEKGFQPTERAWLRPTIEINGLAGGYAGEGFKTVIPAKAIAKVSCRLVPNQDPKKIGKLVADFIEKSTPKGVVAQVKILEGSGKAIRANPHSRIVDVFAKAYEELFKKPCRRIYEGGSIPIITKLAEASQSEVVLMGFGLPDDQVHAPNEHFGIDRIEKGCLVIARSIELLSETSSA